MPKGPSYVATPVNGSPVRFPLRAFLSHCERKKTGGPSRALPAFLIGVASDASVTSSRSYSDSSRVGNGEGSPRSNPGSEPNPISIAGASGGDSISGTPVVPVRLVPRRARAAVPDEPAAPVRRVVRVVARAPVRPELLRPVRRPVVRFAAGRRLAAVFRFAGARFAAVFRFAGARFAAVFRFAVLRFAAVFRFAGARFAAVFRLAVVRFAAVFRLAVLRLAAVLRFAVLRFAVVRLAAVLRFAVLRFAVVRFAVVRLAVVRFAVVRLAAGRRFAVDRFAAVRFVPVLFLVAICLLLVGEFGGNDSAQYAPCIGRFHHQQLNFLR